MGFFASRQYTKLLLIIYLTFFAITTIKINYLQDFLLEHVLTVVLAVFLLLTYKRFRLSNVSYTLIFVFMILHTIGAHYTYSLVPYDDWSRKLLGFSINGLFGFERNQFDRLVHFCFGLLMAYPVREFFLRVVNVKGFWGYYLPFDVMASFSALYELMEWAAASLFGGDLGLAYLGIQGDLWDAQKDMALAISGALTAMFIVAIINFFKKPNFEREISESFHVKNKQPLGEVAYEKMKEELRDKEALKH